MELFLLWLGINTLVGYAIGQKRNQIGASIAISILLGPIGWLIAVLVKGDVRKCPFCAEDVKLAAVVCPHCQRDLPPQVAPPPARPRTAQEKKRTVWLFGSIAAVLIGVFIWAAWYDSHKAERASAEVDRRVARAVQLYPPVTPPSLPAPQFIVITSDVSVYDSAAQEIKLTPGMRLQVVGRSAHDLTIAYEGHTYSIPKAFTEPAK